MYFEEQNKTRANMHHDAYESMKREDRAGIATVARKHTQKQGMEVSALIFQ